MKAIVLAAALALGALYGATANAGEPTCENCDVYRRGVSRKVIPTDDVVCVYFVQPRRDTVMLRLDLKDGKRRFYSKKNASSEGRICVGRHWVRASETMFVCNSNAHADYEPQHVTIVAEKPAHSRKATACLFGKSECASRGFATRQ